MLVSLLSAASAQVGGRNGFDFLEFVQPARVAGIGGANISIFDNDPNMAYMNPGLLNSSMHDRLALNFVDYFAGIKYGNISYTYAIDTVIDRVAQVNINHGNYGDFPYADPSGVLTGGNFTASDLTANLSYSQQLADNFRGGVTMKFIYSVIESYQAFGVGFDLGGSYFNEEKNFSAGLAIRNIGTKVSYTENSERAPLPTNIVLGITKKLQYAPFRLSLTLENLQKWDLTLQDPNLRPQTDPLTGELIPIPQPGFLEKGMRHVVIGGEVLITENFHVRTGFNYRRRQELKVEAKPALTGFSIGVGLRISKFLLSYSRASYHRAGGTNSLSISTRFGDFRTIR